MQVTLRQRHLDAFFRETSRTFIASSLRHWIQSTNTMVETRISFDRSRIRKVRGNVGEFVLEKDNEKGQIFGRPGSPDSTKRISRFASPDRPTIGVPVQPLDTPSDAAASCSRRSLPARASPPDARRRHSPYAAGRAFDQRQLTGNRRPQRLATLI